MLMEPTPFLYLPLYQVYRSTMTINARTTGEPLAFGKSVEKNINELSADVVVFDVTTCRLRDVVFEVRIYRVVLTQGRL